MFEHSPALEHVSSINKSCDSALVQHKSFRLPFPPLHMPPLPWWSVMWPGWEKYVTLADRNPNIHKQGSLRKDCVAYRDHWLQFIFPGCLSHYSPTLLPMKSLQPLVPVVTLGYLKSLQTNSWQMRWNSTNMKIWTWNWVYREKFMNTKCICVSSPSCLTFNTRICASCHFTFMPCLAQPAVLIAPMG